MSRRAQATKAPGLALGDLRRPKRPRGAGIGVKFAVPTCLTVCALLSTLGFILYGNIRRSLDEAIDRAGVFAATALAAPDWAIADNTRRLSGMLIAKVEEVSIWEHGADGKDVLVATATGRDKLPITRFEGSRNDEGTLVERGRIVRPDGVEVPYRSFRHSITRPDNPSKSIAAVQVFLSEEAIAEELSAALQMIIVFVVIGIVLTTVVSIALAKSITAPLHTLIHDIGVVARGDYNHKTRARSRDEVGVLAEAFDEMTTALAEGLVAKQVLSSKEHQEQIAQEIQEKLFPSQLPQISGCELDAVFEAAGEISSDLFDFVDLGEGRTGLLVMTASGKGVPAAIVLAMARSVFRAVASREMGAAETLRRINALFAPDLRRGMYVTAIYSVHDASTGVLQVASAGHKLPVLHFQKSRETLVRAHPGGIAMGLDKGPIFDRSLEEAALQLAGGDLVLLGTAGALSRPTESGDELGEQRFFKVVMAAAKAGHAAGAVARKLASLTAGPIEDDLTLVSLSCR